MANFGFGPSDLVSLLTLAGKTYDNCRKAPQHFGEAGRGAKSLQLVFQSLDSEVSDPKSLLNRDENCKKQIAVIAENCKLVLSQLDGIVVKYASLGSTKIKPLDRLRLPRKEILEIQGKLRSHQTHLISYLETIGVSALGRVEQKFELVGRSHEEVMERFEVAGKSHKEVMSGLDAILRTVDQIAAEIRAGMHPESLFSDHPGDDKEVWKSLRKKLIQHGFTSKFIQPHEDKILERVKEMNELGLLDSDAQVSSDDVGFNNEVPHTSYNMLNTNYFSAVVVSDVESGYESEATLPLRPSRHSRGETGSPERQNSNKERHQSSTSLPLPEVSSHYQPSSTVSYGRSADTQTPSQASMGAPPQKMRVWAGKENRLKFKAEFIHRSGNYIHLRKGDGVETIVLATSLSLPDQEYLESLSPEMPETVPPAATPSVSPTNVATGAGITIPAQPPQQAIAAEPEIETIRREKPETFLGKRSRWKPIWQYRRIKSIPFRREGFDCDDLPLAASMGQYGKVKRLLAKGADIESNGEWVTSTDSEGRTTTTYQRTTTALYRSVMAGYFEVAQLLLDSGADVETENLLHQVASAGKIEYTRLLLEYHARPSRVSEPSRRTALHVASYRGFIDIVDLLLEYDALIDVRDKMRETPLYLASMEGWYEIVHRLVEEGADTSILAQDGQTALYKAGGRGYTDITRLLLSYSADPSLGRGVSGETVLFKSAKKGHTDVVYELLYYGADPDLVNDTKDWAPGSTIDTVIHLLKPEDDPRNNYGLRPLHAAAEAGHAEVVDLLLDYGATVDAPSPSGETALYAAARRKRRGIVDVLLKAGAQLAPQEHVDGVLKLMNSRPDELVGFGKAKGEKPKRVEMISELVSRFSKERLSRGVGSWKRGDSAQGIELITEIVKRVGEGRSEGLWKAIL
jgi:ankyrin repeat protein